MTTSTAHQPSTNHTNTAPWAAPHGLAVTVHHPDGTTSTAQVVALVERDDAAQTVRTEALGTPGPGLVIVRRTYRCLAEPITAMHAEPHTPHQVGTGRWQYDGATITGHEPLTGITRPLPLHDRATN